MCKKYLVKYLHKWKLLLFCCFAEDCKGDMKEMGIMKPGEGNMEDKTSEKYREGSESEKLLRWVFYYSISCCIGKLINKVAYIF